MGASTTAHAQSAEWMSGVTSVKVSLAVAPDSEQLVSATSIKASVERQLARAGIRPSGDSATLRVSIAPFPYLGGAFYWIEVSFWRSLLPLNGQSSIRMGKTVPGYEVVGELLGTSLRPAEDIPRAVDDKVAVFIARHASANGNTRGIGSADTTPMGVISDSLIGLKTVSLSLDVAPVLRTQVAEDRIRSIMTARLEAMGLHVADSAPGAPGQTISVIVDGLKCGAKWCWTVNIRLLRTDLALPLPQRSRRMAAYTWQDMFASVNAMTEIAHPIEDAVDTLFDDFQSEFVSANVRDRTAR
jgi:hypothetical protein